MYQVCVSDKQTIKQANQINKESEQGGLPTQETVDQPNQSNMEQEILKKMISKGKKVSTTQSVSLEPMSPILPNEKKKKDSFNLPRIHVRVNTIYNFFNLINYIFFRAQL